MIDGNNIFQLFAWPKTKYELMQGAYAETGSLVSLPALNTVPNTIFQHTIIPFLGCVSLFLHLGRR